MSALALDPPQLRLAARTLGLESARLRTVSTSAPGLLAGSGEWTGVAALAQQARGEEWAHAVGRTCDPLDVVARVIATFADRVEEAQATIRWWRLRGEEAFREGLQLQRLLTIAEDLARPPLERRLAEAQQLVEQSRRQVEETEELLRRTAEQVASEVAGSWPVRMVTELVWVGEVGLGMVSFARATWQAVLSADIIRHSVAAARAVTTEGRLLLLTRAREAVSAVQWAFLTGGNRLRFFPVLAGPAGVTVSFALSGLHDLITGGGYDGWRGTTTRVLGALAVPASVGIWSMAPPVVGASAAVLAAYSVWSSGNTIYDHRASIARLGRLTYRVAQDAVGELDRRYRITERVREGVDELEDVGEVVVDTLVESGTLVRDATTEHLQPLLDPVQLLPDPGDGYEVTVNVPIPIPVPGVRIPVTIEVPPIELPTFDGPHLDPFEPVNRPWRPGWPELPAPSLPSLPALPFLPSVPSLPDLPSLPSVPSLPDLPSLPFWPDLRAAPWSDLVLDRPLTDHSSSGSGPASQLDRGSVAGPGAP